MKKIDVVNMMALHDRVFLAGRQIGKVASVRSVMDAIIEAAKPKRHYGVKVEHSPEFGLTMEFECPDCHETMRELEFMRSANVLECRCGKSWSFQLYAESEPV